ncbi:glycosyltransferase family 4 protein [Flavobacterium caseinilyticum]|uniref:Glycosyltransferase n=1 Tax=Flavobacterium caseinilyticum TaxID=2541732 RepID=A0A4R5AV66_9FLAO|nr:glycosyltransferase family 4 protein [Flavobacterium caseinilyticum]TDD75990.1 glycosyltransferase [Flavobacterium caseinilyticum]
MRILQLIDSLESGGAERMAVNYANALAGQISFSGLIATRKEGTLLNQLHPGISYLFLNKKRRIDFNALFKLRLYIKQNKVTIIHAHGTSFFLAFLLKATYPSVQLIWHDHYGDSEFLSKRPLAALKVILPFFNGIISVNQKLKIWASEKLKFSNTIYLPNFPSEKNSVDQRTVLEGEDSKRIVCLANLREQKNHFLLLEVAMKVKVTHPDWTFHLVGKDFNDGYAAQIRHLIGKNNLGKKVFLYGSREDIKNILQQSTIAVLSSQSEGLPLALLEYGLAKKPVVVTAVGEISSVVQNGKNGFLVASQSVEAFYEAIVYLIENETLRTNFGNELYATIKKEYSEEGVLQMYLNWLQKNCK